jgi:hypothetical protein
MVLLFFRVFLPASNQYIRIIQYEDVIKGDLIGVGVSGDVLSGTYNRQPVAIKMFLNQKFTNDALFEMRAESATLWFVACFFDLFLCSKLYIPILFTVHWITPTLLTSKVCASRHLTSVLLRNLCRRAISAK